MELSFKGAAIPSNAVVQPDPRVSADINRVLAPAFAPDAAARNAAGPSPMMMISHASMNSTSGEMCEMTACHKQRASNVRVRCSESPY